MYIIIICTLLTVNCVACGSLGSRRCDVLSFNCVQLWQFGVETISVLRSRQFISVSWLWLHLWRKKTTTSLPEMLPQLTYRTSLSQMLPQLTCRTSLPHMLAATLNLQNISATNAATIDLHK